MLHNHATYRLRKSLLNHSLESEECSSFISIASVFNYVAGFDEILGSFLIMSSEHESNIF